MMYGSIIGVELDPALRGCSGSPGLNGRKLIQRQSHGRAVLISHRLVLSLISTSVRAYLGWRCEEQN